MQVSQQQSYPHMSPNMPPWIQSERKVSLVVPLLVCKQGLHHFFLFQRHRRCPTRQVLQVQMLSRWGDSFLVLPPPPSSQNPLALSVSFNPQELSWAGESWASRCGSSWLRWQAHRKETVKPLNICCDSIIKKLNQGKCQLSLALFSPWKGMLVEEQVDSPDLPVEEALTKVSCHIMGWGSWGKGEGEGLGVDKCWVWSGEKWTKDGESSVLLDRSKIICSPSWQEDSSKVVFVLKKKRGGKARLFSSKKSGRKKEIDIRNRKIVFKVILYSWHLRKLW